jgi:hypothetical protein
MKKLIILSLFIGLFFSCRESKYINYYRVTIKTKDGLTLYDDEKPDLNARSGGMFRIIVHTTGSMPPYFEVFGENLIVMRELTKRVEK